MSIEGPQVLTDGGGVHLRAQGLDQLGQVSRVVSTDRHCGGAGQVECGPECRLHAGQAIVGRSEERAWVEVLPHLLVAATEGAHAPGLARLPGGAQDGGGVEEVDTHEETGPDHEDVRRRKVLHSDHAEGLGIPGGHTPGAAQTIAGGVSQGSAGIAEEGVAIGKGQAREAPFGIVEEHGVRFPAEFLGRPLDGESQPDRIKGVLSASSAREEAHLRGEGEPRQQIGGRLGQYRVRAEAEVGSRGVQGGDAEVECGRQEVAVVTRPV